MLLKKYVFKIAVTLLFFSCLNGCGAKTSSTNIDGSEEGGGRPDTNTIPPVKPPGFSNLGNTCFANSTLNLLFHSKQIDEILKNSLQKLSSSEKNNDFALRQAFHKALLNLKTAQTSGKTKLCDELNKLFDAYEAAREVVLGSKLVGGNEKIRKSQADAPEFLSDIHNLLGFPNSNFSYLRFTDNSTKVLAIDESIIYLSMPGKGQKLSLAELFVEQREKGELITGADQVENNRGVKMDSTRFEAVSLPAPSSLFVSLKRFAFDSDLKKIRDGSEVQPSKSLSITVTDKNDLSKSQKITYVLQGIIIHYGSTLESGHYVAYGFNNSSRKWLKYDDASVSEVNEADVFKDAASNGYVYLYELKK